MQERIKKLTKLMGEFDLPGIALNPGPTLTYLTGLEFHLMERPTVLLITVEGKTALVLPALEVGKLASMPIKIEAFNYSDDPATRSEAFVRAAELLNFSAKELGVEATRMRYLELMYLGDAFPELGFLDASACLAELRIVKDEDEQGKMRQAAVIAQNALLATLKDIKAGMTEVEVANQLMIQLLRAGSDPSLPFAPIVAFGENTADPHSVPSGRRLKPGDLLLVDWGASYQGYFSDITRTFTLGEVDPELQKIGEIVLRANLAGQTAGCAGIEAGAVDRAARAVITDAGYGHAFIHRTGHGLGMEAHEEPYIFDTNPRILTSGMTFTVEPGIYLPGKGGVRIEDDMVVTETGFESLTDMPRQVLPLEAFMEN
ncbi:MAG: aminopeptidase P family protein [Chloroflexi bacterium]|jgi:Xaa-Pro dipeptidase|nr:aminopeptidase P family protein [Chloroflexota bacterium]